MFAVLMGLCALSACSRESGPPRAHVPAKSVPSVPRDAVTEADVLKGLLDWVLNDKTNSFTTLEDVSTKQSYRARVARMLRLGWDERGGHVALKLQGTTNFTWSFYQYSMADARIESISSGDAQEREVALLDEVATNSAWQQIRMGIESDQSRTEEGRKSDFEFLDRLHARLTSREGMWPHLCISSAEPDGTRCAVFSSGWHSIRFRIVQKQEDWTPVGTVSFHDAHD
jgi:hypothetical protein